MSVSTENFIKTIFKLEQNQNKDAKPGSVAELLGISNAAATDMAQKLSNKGYIEYEKYKELKLSKQGRTLALNIIRKHRLWETFLFQVLGLSLHEIHREAENLEHQTSDFLALKISAYLNHPKVDPHGDPIPEENGEFAINSNSIPLSQAKEEKAYKVVRLNSSEREFFELCDTYKINPENEILIQKQWIDTQMTEFIIHGTKLILHKTITSLIYVELIENK